MTTKARYQIKNWSEYQSGMRKGRKPPKWVKLHSAYWADFHVRDLSLSDRAILLGIFSHCDPTTGAVHLADDELCYLIDCKSIPWGKFERWCKPVGVQVATNGQPVDAKTPPNVSLEGEGEGEGERDGRQGSAAAEFSWTASFDEFYALYPKKQKRKKALEFWMKIPKQTKGFFQVIMAGVTALKLTEDYTNPERRRFIPQPSTWINGEMWENEYEDAYKQPKVNASGDRYLSDAELAKLDIPNE